MIIPNNQDELYDEMTAIFYLASLGYTTPNNVPVKIIDDLHTTLGLSCIIHNGHTKFDN